MTNKGNDGEVGEKGDDSGIIRRSNRCTKKVGGVQSVRYVILGFHVISDTMLRISAVCR